MNTFTAHVERGSNQWWVAQLIEYPGVITQTKRLDQIADELRDALTLFPELTDSPETAVINLNIAGDAENQAQSARAELEQLRRKENTQLHKITQIAHNLAASGYNYRDIAYLLGITYGRVGQILKLGFNSENP
jgi:hypothetical protein